MYGVTVIKEEGSETAERVFSLWAELFACGPKILKLTGSFGWQVENDPVKDGYERIVPNSEGYEELEMERDLLINKLKALASYAQKIKDSNGEYYILHLGI